MEIQYKKHVRVICDLEKGDKVIVDNEFGPPLKGKEMEIEDVFYRGGHCESGFMVKISGYERLVDSNWLNKIPKQNG